MEVHIFVQTSCLNHILSQENLLGWPAESKSLLVLCNKYEGRRISFAADTLTLNFSQLFAGGGILVPLLV